MELISPILIVKFLLIHNVTNLGSQSSSTEVSDHNKKVSTTFGSTVTGGDYSSTALETGSYVHA